MNSIILEKELSFADLSISLSELYEAMGYADAVPDESKAIDEGAVAPWNSLMWSLMTDVCRAMVAVLTTPLVSV